MRYYWKEKSAGLCCACGTAHIKMSPCCQGIKDVHSPWAFFKIMVTETAGDSALWLSIVCVDPRWDCGMLQSQGYIPGCPAVRQSQYKYLPMLF